jgi:hypothetical protein
VCLPMVDSRPPMIFSRKSLFVSRLRMDLAEVVVAIIDESKSMVERGSFMFDAV